MAKKKPAARTYTNGVTTTPKLIERTVTSVVDVLTELQKYDTLMMFRGEGNKSWKLRPSLGRRFKHLTSYEDWNTFEESLIEEFKKYARPYLKTTPGNEVEWLITAQHHGLPTRLLDWTRNPLKGLFFAVEDTKKTKDATLWGFEPAGWMESMTDTQLKAIRNDWIEAYFPDHINDRVIAQESCFTIFPFPATKIPIPPMEKITPYDRSIASLVRLMIPARYKEPIRLELGALGITHSTIFPSLDGLAKTMKAQRGLE